MGCFIVFLALAGALVLAFIPIVRAWRDMPPEVEGQPYDPKSWATYDAIMAKRKARAAAKAVPVARHPSWDALDAARAARKSEVEDRVKAKQARKNAKEGKTNLTS